MRAVKFHDNGENTIFLYITLAYDKTTYIHFLGYIHIYLVLEENKVPSFNFPSIVFYKILYSNCASSRNFVSRECLQKWFNLKSKKHS